MVPRYTEAGFHRHGPGGHGPFQPESDTADGDAEIEPQLELNQTRLGLEACLRSLGPAKRAAKGSGVA